MLLEHIDRRVHLGRPRGNVGKVESRGCVVWGVAFVVDVHCCRLDAGIPRGIVGFYSDGAVGVEDGALVVAGLITAVVAGVLVVMGLLRFTFRYDVRGEGQVTNRLL